MLSPAPGTTLSAKRRLSHSTPKSIHIRRPTPQEDTPASGKLSPVPQPVLSSWVTQPSAGSTGSVIVVARTKENSRIVSAATGLSMLANGASERPKLPHSPVVAKLQALGMYVLQCANSLLFFCLFVVLSVVPFDIHM